MPLFSQRRNIVVADEALDGVDAAVLVIEAGRWDAEDGLAFDASRIGGTAYLGNQSLAGFGDPTGRGWVGHIVEASYAAGLPGSWVQALMAP